MPVRGNRRQDALHRNVRTSECRGKVRRMTRYRIILERTPFMCASYQTVEEIDMSPAEYLKKLNDEVYVSQGTPTVTYRIIHIEEK